MSYRGTRTAELIAARRSTWSTSVLVLRTEQFSSRKSSVLPISKLSRRFLQCWFFSFWVRQWEHIRCALQVDRLSGLRRICLPVAKVCFRKKKKNNHWPIEKSKNRQKKEDSCRNKGQERGWQDELASLFSALQSCMTRQGRARVRMPRL